LRQQLWFAIGATHSETISILLAGCVDVGNYQDVHLLSRISLHGNVYIVQDMMVH